MKETILELASVHVTQFDPKEGVGEFMIGYLKNKRPVQYAKKLVVEHPEGIVEDILLEVKRREKIEISDTDDILGSIFIIRLKDEEKTEEKLYNFFARLCEKTRTIKNLKDHSQFMKMLDEIKSQKITFSG